MPDDAGAQRQAGTPLAPRGVLRLELPRLDRRWVGAVTLLASSLLAFGLLGFWLTEMWRSGSVPLGALVIYLAGAWSAFSAVAVWGTLCKKRFLELDDATLTIGAHLPPFRAQLVAIPIREVAAAVVLWRPRNWGAGEAWYLEINSAGGARHCCGEGASRADLELLAERLNALRGEAHA